VRRLDRARAKATQVRIAEVIRQNEHHIRLAGENGRNKSEEGEGSSEHVAE